MTDIRDINVYIGACWRSLIRFSDSVCEKNHETHCYQSRLPGQQETTGQISRVFNGRLGSSEESVAGSVADRSR